MQFEQLAQLTGGRLAKGVHSNVRFTGVSIDSRTIKEGELFIAIRGEVNDGHQFIDRAAKCDAAGAMVEIGNVSVSTGLADFPMVAVPDSYKAMTRLAQQYLEECTARKIGITGSNGKTTTKELCGCLLEAVESGVYRSPGNLNNLFGVPLSIFAMPSDTKVAVYEMGISTPNEMSDLARVVNPDAIVITNVGPTHLEFLHTVEEVAEAKLELMAAVSLDVPVVLNADDQILMKEARKPGRSFTTFGIDNPADYTTDEITTDEQGAQRVTIEGKSFLLPLAGKHQVYNLLAAYAIVRSLGYSFDDIDTSVLQLTTARWRGETIRLNGIRILADCYNANPDSVRASLDTFFGRAASGRRVICLGDMAELGAGGPDYHGRVGEQLAEREFALCALVGPLSQHTLDAAMSSGVPDSCLQHFDTAAHCARFVREFVREGDDVLVKGSRSIGMEVIIDALSRCGDGA
ncbi:MAG: UDP-N-acetylmuramoyl-tripeptide--D-alanyl-D-alanine ligase [Candidatus Zixiibacteriota bacterium]